ncbi:hypothetical protein TNCV_2928101 [Trichonephila clavipes]|nr:hypothetical protein TNCV_2928101 [Trichonephila clavipes]
MSPQCAHLEEPAKNTMSESEECKDRQITSNLSSPLDNLRLPLEQQLMDIMRTTMDGQDHYKGLLLSFNLR